MLGIFQVFTPKVVKKYENLAGRTIDAFSHYVEEARRGELPTDEHTYKMVDGEWPKLEALLKKE